MPEDTQESLNFTYSFAEETNSEMVNFYCAMAYPGSPLHLEAKRKKLKLPSTYSGYSQHSYDTQNLSSEKLTSKDILKFRDESWMKYHTNPKYLTLIKSKFGDNAEQNIKNMTKINLKRKILGD